LITTKFIKKASPFVVVLAILAVCGSLVGASVYFFATATTPNATHVTTNEIKMTIEQVGTSPNYATDTAGIQYALHADAFPKDLTGITLTVKVTDTTGATMAWSNLGPVSVVYAGGAPIPLTAESGNGATLTYDYSYTGIVAHGVAYDAVLTIPYNIPGEFSVTATLTGNSV
jgi:hypothetical protein